MDRDARRQTAPEMMTRPEVERLARLSCSSLYRLVRSGSFPPPVKYPGGAVRWYRGEIVDWLTSRPRAGEQKRATE